MGKPIMHSARALFLTFLALEKRKIAPQSRKETQRKFYLCDLCASAVKKNSANSAVFKVNHAQREGSFSYFFTS
jgi:hypothetical protein